MNKNLPHIKIRVSSHVISGGICVGIYYYRKEKKLKVLSILYGKTKERDYICRTLLDPNGNLDLNDVVDSLSEKYSIEKIAELIEENYKIFPYNINIFEFL